MKRPSIREQIGMVKANSAVLVGFAVRGKTKKCEPPLSRRQTCSSGPETVGSGWRWVITTVKCASTSQAWDAQRGAYARDRFVFEYASGKKGGVAKPGVEGEPSVARN